MAKRGRPSKDAEVLAYLAEHPNARTREVARAVGICEETVRHVRNRHGIPHPKKAPPMPNPDEPTALERLRAWLATHPNPCGDYNVSQIAIEIGTSRERVRQLMPEYTRRARQQFDARVARFVEEHPEAMLRRSDGGLGFTGIAEAMGVSPVTIRNAFRRLGLPTVQYRIGKYAQAVPPNATTRERLNTYHAYRGREIVGEVTCIECGAVFALTRYTQRNIQQGLMRQVCGIRCGIAASRRLGPKAPLASVSHTGDEAIH